MPIKTSAKKYMRQSARRAQTNKIVKGVVKSAVRKTKEAAQAGNKSEAQEWFQKAQKSLDKAVSKNIMKKNTAARKKSRLSAMVKAAASK
ncbi:MAG: 30S ribosomal protein S20 [Candidatus Moraniibacteriota bacterium]